jgi:hypothetical protein
VQRGLMAMKWQEEVYIEIHWADRKNSPM